MIVSNRTFSYNGIKFKIEVHYFNDSLNSCAFQAISLPFGSSLLGTEKEVVAECENLIKEFCNNKPTTYEELAEAIVNCLVYTDKYEAELDPLLLKQLLIGFAP
jgi:hypothetical protein